MPVKVLVVEDNMEMREMLALTLDGEGYEVTTAQHGEEAQQVLRASEQLPNLIVLDLQMPVMDGETFLKTLPDAGIPGAMAIPVLVVTASRHTLGGVAGHIRKPFELDDLLDAVRRLASST